MNLSALTGGRSPGKKGQKGEARKSGSGGGGRGASIASKTGSRRDKSNSFTCFSDHLGHTVLDKVEEKKKKR